MSPLSAPRARNIKFLIRLTDIEHIGFMFGDVSCRLKMLKQLEWSALELWVMASLRPVAEQVSRSILLMWTEAYLRRP